MVSSPCDALVASHLLGLNLREKVRILILAPTTTTTTQLFYETCRISMISDFSVTSVLWTVTHHTTRVLSTDCKTTISAVAIAARSVKLKKRTWARTTSRKIVMSQMMTLGMNMVYDRKVTTESRLRAAATTSIESLVLSFLTQMNLSLRAASGRDDPEDMPAPAKRSRLPKIELQLADRKKIMADGYALLPFIIPILHS